jgi:hypothetical protein
MQSAYLTDGNRHLLLASPGPDRVAATTTATGTNVKECQQVSHLQPPSHQPPLLTLIICCPTVEPHVHMLQVKPDLFDKPTTPMRAARAAAHRKAIHLNCSFAKDQPQPESLICKLDQAPLDLFSQLPVPPLTSSLCISRN